MDLAQTVEDFHRDGFVRVPGLLSEGELRALQHDTQHIIDGGYEDVANPTDYRTAPDPDTGKDVFNRVQFVFPLATTEPNPLLALLGHPQAAGTFRCAPATSSTAIPPAPSRHRRRDPGERLPAGGSGKPPGAPSAWSTAPIAAGASACAAPSTTSSSPWPGCGAKGSGRVRKRASTAPGPRRGSGSRGMPSRPARRVPTRRTRLRSTTGCRRDSMSSRIPLRTRCCSEPG